MREIRVKDVNHRSWLRRLVTSPGFVIPVIVGSFVSLMIGLPMGIVFEDESTVDRAELEEQLLSSSWTEDGKTFGVKRVYCDPEDVDDNGVGVYVCQVGFQGRPNDDMSTMRFDFDLQERWYTIG